MLCTLNCGRRADDDEGICQTCIVWLRSKSNESSADFRRYCKRTEVRVKRQQQITGKNGDGPKEDGYVWRLLAKRKARARIENQRKTRPEREIRHFPRASE